MADFMIFRGTTNVLNFAVTLGSVPYDLTGITTMWFTVKQNFLETDATALFQKTIGSGINVDAGTAGTGEITILPADTDVLDVGVTGFNMYYDLKAILVNGSECILINGRLLIMPSVTIST
jgi:hypothetical protein